MSSKLIIVLIMFLLTGIACRDKVKTEAVVAIGKRTVSFTFDDGSTNDILGYKFEEWNDMMLSSMKEAEIKSMFFVTGVNKLDEKGKYLLNTWDKEGHNIANHTFSHPNFHDDNNSVEMFEEELMRTDSIINQYKNYSNYFRFPYLKEGKERDKIDEIRSVLKKTNYQNGYVTIDASDWYVNSRLINHMTYRKKVDTLAFQDFYINHILDRAKFYEGLSFDLNGRHIKHTLLLHHNLTSALFLDNLIERFKAEGWDIVDAIDAYKDPIYTRLPMTAPAGESLIWSLAKETGKFEERLRYPAEDSRYEKEEMDRLGL